MIEDSGQQNQLTPSICGFVDRGQSVDRKAVIKTAWTYFSAVVSVRSIFMIQLIREVQSAVGLTQEPEVLGSIPGLATYFHFSFL